MAWSEFDSKSALERDMLERALPLVPTTSDSSLGMTIDLDTDRMDARVGVHEVIGATPESCVALLRIRPLLVGAAWKVIDLLLEEQLAQLGLPPGPLRGWSINAKINHARSSCLPQPATMDTTAWPVLMDTYVACEDIRHSLVHRRAHTDSANSLVGVDDGGNPLRPLTAHEQESLVRAATRAASVVISPTPDQRLNSVLLYELSQLGGLHGHSIAASNWSRPPVELMLPLSSDPLRSGFYPLDIPRVRAHRGLMSACHADLIVQFKDRPGQELRGRLEDAPDHVEMIDPDRPPAWLT